MLPDGIRYASTRKTRTKRKIRIAPTIDFTFSHCCPRDPPDAAARGDAARAPVLG
jgi:hypothetical protein